MDSLTFSFESLFVTYYIISSYISLTRNWWSHLFGYFETMIIMIDSFGNDAEIKKKDNWFEIAIVKKVTKLALALNTIEYVWLILTKVNVFTKIIVLK